MYPRCYRKIRMTWLSASTVLCIAFTGSSPGASENSQASRSYPRTPQNQASVSKSDHSQIVANMSSVADAAFREMTEDPVDPTPQLNALKEAIKPANTALPEAEKDRDKALSIINALPPGSPSLSIDSVTALRTVQQALANKVFLPDSQALGALNTRLKNHLDPNSADGLQKLRDNLQSALDEAVKIDITTVTDPMLRKTFGETRTQANGVLSKMDTLLSDIKGKILPDDNTSLIDRVKGVADYAKQLTDLLQKAYEASGMINLAADAKPDAARTTLAAGLRGLLAAERVRVALLPIWKDTKDALAGVTDFTSTEVEDALAVMTKSVADKDKGVLTHLATWFDAIRKAATDEIDMLHARTEDLSKTLDARERNTAIVTKAASTRDEANRQVYDLHNITADMTALFAFWEASGLKSEVVGAEKAFTALRETSEHLSIQAGVLDSLISGDADHFVQEQVRLFYFTDVPRVIQAINPKAHLVTDTRTEAARQRKNNANADLLNEEKQIAALNEEIARHQDRVRALQESVRQANAQLADAKNRQQQAQARQRALNRQANAAANQKADLTAQKDALTSQNQVLDQQITEIDQQLAKPEVQSDPVKVADLQNQKLQKQQQKNANTARINDIDLKIASLVTGTVAQQDATNAANDYGTAITTIEGQISQFNDQLAQLTPKLAAAKQDLIDAQVRRAAARQEAYLLAQAEAEAFGEARDNQPFWYAPSEGILSNDPAHRVILFGYADSSVINIRGLPRDVERVKEIIATLDRPAPQSRITLYTLQMNGANTQRLNNALKTVDDVLRDVRGAIVLVQDKFRDSVNQEVERSAAKARVDFSSARPEDRARLRRYAYYAPEISQSLGFPKNAYRDTDYASVAHLTRWTLPDPANSTTLGEAMFVYSLGRYDSRMRILGRFIAEIYKEYKVLDRNRGANNKHPHYGHLEGTRRFLHAIRPILEDDKCKGHLYCTFKKIIGDDHVTLGWLKAFLQDKDIPNPDPNGPTGGYPHFFVTILGSVEKGTPNQEHEMTANQLEILKALQTKGREAVSAEVNYLLREIDRLPASERWGSNTVGDMYREQYLPLIGWLYSKFAAPYGGAGQPIDLSRASWRAQGQEAVHLTGARPGKAEYLKADLHAHSIAQLVQQRAALSQATARVAAADDMIKRMIIVVEDDLDHFFISPALENLRHQINAQGIEFGTLQRESLLATNRLVARVDPRATAIANLPGGTDILNQAQQLGQIAAQFRESQRSAKLNTTLPALGTGVSALAQGHVGTALAFGGLLSLLGDLAASPQAPQGELFSINSGNKFQITPIFDPSGQAMRFKFDYVAQTLVRAPDGSVTPDPSRVDRHTVNTEVQLTNLEVREISRFEANSQLGTPPVRSGGLPLINQIPLLRDIPILGYYYRRNASAAKRQESIIFAQTSLYPTIGDIMNLLTDVPLRSELISGTPRYLQGDPLLALASATLEKNSVTYGAKLKGVVKLNFPAPSGGVPVGLLSSDDKTVLQDLNGLPITSVVVPGGEQIATFQVSTTPDSQDTVYITASYGGILKKADLSVNPPSAPAADLEALTFDKPFATGGNIVTGTITFKAQPTAAGVIKLDSNNDALYFVKNHLPFQGTDIDPVTRKLKFTAQTHPVARMTPTVVTAEAGGTMASGALLLNPPRLKSFYLVPVQPQKQYQALLVLESPAPAGIQVVVSCQSPYLPMKETRTFDTGKQVLVIPIPFKYLPDAVPSPQHVKIWAKIGNGEARQVTLTLTHPPVMSRSDQHSKQDVEKE